MSIEANRNRFKGRIRQVVDGPVVSEVLVDTDYGTLTSVVASQSVRELGLKPGTDVFAHVKATEIILARI